MSSIFRHRPLKSEGVFVLIKLLPLERRTVLPLTDGFCSLTLQNGDRVDRTFGLDAIITVGAGERVSCERLFLYIIYL